MKDDVEDFLKRVAQMRAEAQAKAQQANQQRRGQQAQQQIPAQRQPHDAAQRQQQGPVQRPPQAPRREQQRPRPLQPPIEAEVVEAQIVDRGNQLDKGVREHLRGVEEIADHTRKLGADVDQADDKLTAHLHQVFDHQIGQLVQSGPQQTASREQVSPEGLSPDSISRLLRSPAAARDAVILSEILQRPVERW
jgi:hypothetical protein